MARSHLEQASSLFGFLKDLLGLRNRPAKTLQQYSIATGHWVHHLDDTPRTKSGIAFWGSLGMNAVGAASGDMVSALKLATTTIKEAQNSILRVPKVLIPEPPQPSENLGPWISGEIEDPTEQLHLYTFDEMENQDLSDPDASSIDLSQTKVDYKQLQREFESWIKQWEVWAEKTKSSREVRKLYSSLFDARSKFKEQSQDWEFVLGVGRLRLRVGSDQLLDRHLFTLPCVIDLDEDTGTLFVRLDETAKFTIEDDWIQGIARPNLGDLQDTKTLLDEIEDLEGEAIKRALNQLANKYRAGLITEKDPGDVNKRDSLILAPSLLLRKRGKQDLIDLLKTLESLFGANESLPAPLQALLEPGFAEASSTSDWSGDGAVVSIDSDTYLPLALNERQVKALERADTRNATVIQGPPGTGKTRTIAVMVTHFLSKGQRVLVTAETSQALREVRDQLPGDIRDLAVASLGGGKSDNDDLQKAVNALQRENENRAELSGGFKEYEEKAKATIDEFHRERAETIRKIIDLRSQEANHLSIEGLEGSPAHLAWTHLSQRSTYAWLDDLSDPESPAPQLSADQAESLSISLKSSWSEPFAVSSTLKLPALDALWSEDQIRKAIGLKKVKGMSKPDLTLDADAARELLIFVEVALDARLTLQRDTESWINAFIEASIGLDESPILKKVELAQKNLEGAKILVQNIGDISEIECGPTTFDWLPILDGLDKRITEKGELNTKVTGGLKRPLIAGALMKNATTLLESVRISGKAPHKTQDIARIRALVQYDHILKTHRSHLQIVDSSITSNRLDTVIWTQGQTQILQAASIFNDNCQRVRKFLMGKISRSSDYVSGSLDLNLLRDALIGITATSDLREYAKEVKSHSSEIRFNLGERIPDYAESYIAAIEAEDIDVFSAAKIILQNHIMSARVAKLALEHCSDLLKVDKSLVTTFEHWIDERPDSIREREILELVRGLVEALRWKRIGDALNERVSEDYGSMFRNVKRLDLKIEKEIQELSRRRSWKKALERIDPQTVISMNRYAYESRKLGAGTGASAIRRRREIRNYLQKCTEAIPAWIMPISRVAQQFTPKIEMFDVVIVDEASQAGLDSLFLLALAKRIVIVGDHKQVSPDTGYLRNDDVQQIVSRHLTDDPRAANWANADMSLFDECKAAFGTPLTLTEHRRCVPGIIGFSNQIAYVPENLRLIPVRQTGSESLPPIKTVFVQDGYVRGKSAAVVNPPEAEVVADQIAEMIKDKKYKGLSIGVITMQGSAQQDLIRNRLNDRIDPAEIEKRQIRVGIPSSFQGSERNVIVLSMVMAPGRKSVAQTTEKMVQRYNVAMSRAKDQVILVHSLKAADLPNVNDLRRKLIDYCHAVETNQNDVFSNIRGLVPEDEIVEPFESLFEQRVHNRLVERGYSVIPQYEPEIDGHDYRIDLVVVGPYGKFAIECDGDFWHGPEAFASDLARQQNLENCGWRFFRIPESEFYENPDFLIDLWPMLDQLGSVLDAPVKHETQVSDSESHLVPIVLEEDNGMDGEAVIDEDDSDRFDSGFPKSAISLSTQPKEIIVDGLRIREFPKPLNPEYSWLEPFRSWDREDLSGLTSVNSMRGDILGNILEIVRVEGPILGSYLMRRHYKATGGSSLSSNNERAYLKQLQRLLNRADLVAEDQDLGSTLASATFRVHNQSPVITRVRGARDLYDLPPREIAHIVKNILRVRDDLSLAANRIDVYREVLLLLDFTKVTKKAEEHLDKIVAVFSNEI